MSTSNLIWCTENAIQSIPVDGMENKELYLLITNAYSQWKLKPTGGLIQDYLNQTRVALRDGQVAVSRITDPEEWGVSGDIPFITPVIIPLPEKFIKNPINVQDVELKFASTGNQKYSLLNIPDDQLENPFAYSLVPLPLNQDSLACELLSDESAVGIEYSIPNKIDKKKVVVIGIIDDAINAVHERFCNAEGYTRLDYLWVQDAKAIDRRKAKAKNYVPYGRERNRSEIDTAKERNRGDEQAIWRELEMVTDGVSYRQSTLNLRRSHGTHVADLAVGEDPLTGNLVNNRIIGVQLPVLATQDTSGASLIAVIRDAAAFIYRRAERISKALKYPVPVVLNISYGIAGGARDGAHILERSLASMATRYQNRVSNLDEVPKIDRHKPPAINVLPAGNGHLARGHARSLEGSFDELNLRLQLQPEDATNSYMELWFPKDTENISVKISTPDSALEYAIEYKNLSPKNPNQTKSRKAHVLRYDTNKEQPFLCRVTIDEPSIAAQNFRPQRYWRILISFAPTSNQYGLPTAPNGEWTIDASKEGGSGPISSWISRDESLDGFAQLGRQAYFVDDHYDQNLFDGIGDIAVDETDSENSIIDRNNTLSGIASLNTENNNLVVAANYWDNLHATPYTAAVDPNDSNQILASFSADTSRALPGILASGSRTGAVVPQNGTSVAVPQMVRWLSHELSQMSLEERKIFNVDDYVRNHLEQGVPARPTLTRPERITKPEIREQRLSGGFLHGVSQNEPGRLRGVREKR